ncbi:MAG: arginine--tRNA ligase [Nitrospirae bacterium]|nr:arginine--tRNA ligase [Nitrospirota bacterium]
MTVKEDLADLLQDAWDRARGDGELSVPFGEPPALELPRKKGHGDLASTLALVLAPLERKPPRKVAEILLAHLADRGRILDRAEVAGPGFLNFFIQSDYWREALRDLLRQGEAYGAGRIGEGKRVLLEFVSANPTGPLHVGHARGAALGDALANLLAAAGYAVDREYYINDAGKQVETLARSVYARYRELMGDTVPFPEEGYRGEYIQTIAREILEREGPRYREVAEETWYPSFLEQSLTTILGWIRSDLEAFAVRFDRWVSERSLFRDGKVAATLSDLKARGQTYLRDGAIHFASTAFGDDKDRVVVKENGEHTYFASDIAYHREKFARGYDLMVDLWGADHGGYLTRVQAAMQALDCSVDRLRIVILQMVTVLREGKPAAMSKREGEYILLREVLEEVGKDAARFMFLTRRADSHLEFDLEVAKRQSSENPVYYVQYAHARICSLFHQAAERGIALLSVEAISLDRLTEPEEIALLKHLAFFPPLVEESARALEPHRLTGYLLDLAAAFHGCYFQHRVITDDRDLTLARLALAQGVGIVLRKALGILGVSAPERM